MVEITNVYFSVWEAGNLEIRVPACLGSWWGNFFLVCRKPPSCCILTWQRESFNYFIHLHEPQIFSPSASKRPGKFYCHMGMVLPTTCVSLEMDPSQLNWQIKKHCLDDTHCIFVMSKAEGPGKLSWDSWLRNSKMMNVCSFQLLSLY